MSESKRIKSCPKCKSDDIEIRDCGYNTFNCGSVKCRSCGIGRAVSGDTTPKDWNGFVCDYLLWESGLKKIEQAGLTTRELKALGVKALDEYSGFPKGRR